MCCSHVSKFKKQKMSLQLETSGRKCFPSFFPFCYQQSRQMVCMSKNAKFRVSCFWLKNEKWLMKCRRSVWRWPDCDPVHTSPWVKDECEVLRVMQRADDRRDVNMTHLNLSSFHAWLYLLNGIISSYNTWTFWYYKVYTVGWKWL